jgi:hypothetical protein
MSTTPLTVDPDPAELPTRVSDLTIREKPNFAGTKKAAREQALPPLVGISQQKHRARA